MFVKRLIQLVPTAARLNTPQGKAFKKALTPLMVLHSISPIGQTQNRSLTTKTLTKSIELLSNSNKEIKSTPGNPLQLVVPGGQYEERPLSILLCWLMSEKKHVMKYARFYLDQGFDVLTVRVTPWQLLWPVSGTQVVAKDLVNFMSHNGLYKPMMLHGFSVGGYLWGEALNLMEKDLDKYRPIIEGISGQIWDSVVDFEGIPTGMPKAVFPKNAVLRKTLEAYIKYHMAAFENTATKHYLRSSKCYHNSVVDAPALFLCSLDDPVGAVSGIKKVADNWELKGMKVYLKAWESSPHVSHLHHHPEEYNQEMKTFLEMLGLVSYPEKFLLKAVGRA
ncbi:unnamed protein product [Orchesella dallaii]|uniref:Transmembrane protein n=1 Tax=Orchesella dallaii TaxID=48710 RepID=A0ABP1PXC5_9HEXA